MEIHAKITIAFLGLPIQSNAMVSIVMVSILQIIVILITVNVEPFSINFNFLLNFFRWYMITNLFSLYNHFKYRIASNKGTTYKNNWRNQY